MSQEIQQLILKREQLLQENPDLIRFQRQINKVLESGKPHIDKCQELLNLARHQSKLLQDSIKSVSDDLEELKDMLELVHKNHS